MREQKRYDAIDGLRAFSAIGIVLMHVLANGKYNIGGFVFDKLIPSFTNLVFLFMIISSFSMCCGYFDKVINNQISIESFYKKRFIRIWPYFALLSLLDLCVSPSLSSFYEVLANLTLCFGLLPNANIEVIGVGWFLGLIFVFYMIFPFFCFLLANKRRAWFTFGVSVLLHILCKVYFTEAHRTNIIYSGVYLVAGGLVYLYKERLSELSSRYRWLVLGWCAVAAYVYFWVGGTAIMLILYTSLLIYAIGIQKKGGLSNSFTRFISGISMEIYLCHMVVYRALEKVKLVHLFSSDIFSYVVASAVTIIGAVIFAKAMQWFLTQGQNMMKKKVMIKKGRR